MRLTTQADVSGAIERLKSIGTAVSDRAVVRAVNKVAAQVKTQSAREIRDAGYGMKISDIKKAITVFRANRGLVVATVKAKGRPIGLIKYGARQTSTGVRVNVKDGAKFIRGAFIATMSNGHTGVYVRENDGSERGMRIPKKKHGMPIRELFGPSIPKAFINQRVRENLVAYIRDRFPTVLAQEVRFENLKRAA